AQLAYAALKRWQKSKTIISIVNEVERQGRNVSVVTIINGNKPFLVDSIMSELSNHAGHIYMLVHPVLDITRHDEKLVILGEASQLPPADGVERVSVMQIHLSVLGEQAQEELRSALEQVIGQVDLAVGDWKPMLTRLDQAIVDYKRTYEMTKNEAMPEAIAFLEWLRDDRFI